MKNNQLLSVEYSNVLILRETAYEVLVRYLYKIMPPKALHVLLQKNVNTLKIFLCHSTIFFHETKLLQAKKNHVHIRNACKWILGKQVCHVFLIFSDLGCFLISHFIFFMQDINLLVKQIKSQIRGINRVNVFSAA